jgi:hypothetical protein
MRGSLNLISIALNPVGGELTTRNLEMCNQGVKFEM